MGLLIGKVIEGSGRSKSRSSVSPGLGGRLGNRMSNVAGAFARGLDESVPAHVTSARAGVLDVSTSPTVTPRAAGVRAHIGEKTIHLDADTTPSMTKSIPARKAATPKGPPTAEPLPAKANVSPRPGMPSARDLADALIAAKKFYPNHKGAVGSIFLEGETPLALKSGVEGGAWAGAHKGGIPRGKGYGFTKGGPSQGNIATHVEGHAAAYMTQRGATRATLVVSTAECAICSHNLSASLPPGAKLTVISPGRPPTVYWSSHGK